MIQTYLFYDLSGRTSAWRHPVAAVVAMGTLGRGLDDLEDGRQRRRPGRDPGGGDGDLSAGMDPDRLLQQSSRFVNRAAGYQNGNRSSWARIRTAVTEI